MLIKYATETYAFEVRFFQKLQSKYLIQMMQYNRIK